MKTRHGNEDRVNRGHRNTKHDGSVARHGDSADFFRTSVGRHRRLEETRYGENAFEAFRNCARVDLIEGVPAFLFGLDDLRRRQLMQVARDNRPILGQAGGDGAARLLGR
jgi:hypothetical protein